jgi:DNA-binding transcriptional LysR family regulator
MDPHQLRTFVTVVRTGSFSRAAAELGYTQAAVSQQIAALEADLRTKLLNRRPVTPTEPGTRLLEHANPILLRLDAARADVLRMTGPPAARLTIGLSPLAGVAATLALTALRQSMPRLEVIVQVAGRESIAAETAAGNLDAGIVDGLAAPGDPLALSEASPLTATGIAEEPVVVPLPPGHPLASRTQLSLEELADARWIDAPDVAVPLPGIRQATATEGFRAAIRYDGTDLHTLLLLTGQGHGLTLLPLSALAPTAAAALAAAPLTAVPVTSPRLVNRAELLHGYLPPQSPAAALARIASTH